VSAHDLQLLRGNYGARVPAGAEVAAISVLPEPCTAASLLPLAALVLRRRQRRRR
jgi:hypothetical protein